MGKRVEKYQSFNSLKGLNESYNRIEYEKNKITKPQLSDDQKERVNLALLNYFVTKDIVLIKFFNEGYIHEYQGSIKKLDVISNSLVFKDKTKIHFDDILDVMPN